MANMEPEEAIAVPPTAQLLGLMCGKAQTNLLFMAATLGPHSREGTEGATK
jgi:hypothetical protein